MGEQEEIVGLDISEQKWKHMLGSNIQCRVK